MSSRMERRMTNLNLQKEKELQNNEEMRLGEERRTTNMNLQKEKKIHKEKKEFHYANHFLNKNLLKSSPKNYLSPNNALSPNRNLELSAMICFHQKISKNTKTNFNNNNNKKSDVIMQKEKMNQLKKILNKCEDFPNHNKLSKKATLIEGNFSLSAIKLKNASSNINNLKLGKRNKKGLSISEDFLLSYPKMNWKSIDMPIEPKRDDFESKNEYEQLYEMFGMNKIKEIMINNDKKKKCSNPIILDLVKKIEIDNIKRISIRKNINIKNPNLENQEEKNNILNEKQKIGKFDNDKLKNSSNSSNLIIKGNPQLFDPETLQKRKLHYNLTKKYIIYQNKIIHLINSEDLPQKSEKSENTDLFTKLYKKKVSPTEYFLKKKR